MNPSDTTVSMPLLDEMLREQLKVWPLAAGNHAALGQTQRRRFSIGGLDGAFQCNPARMVSTGAKVDKKSIAERPCFLCTANRPPEQFALPFSVPGGKIWDILVNPFPILPWHFTIASREHEPQSGIPLDMIVLAERLPGAVMFYNGARAGASAPDHLHFQMVLKNELPLINYLERTGSAAGLPYAVKYWKVTPDSLGMSMIREFVASSGVDKVSGKPDTYLVNAFVWMGDDGMLRLASVPRSAHRPSCYAAEGTGQLLVSPGAIDVAGLIILPRKEDFDRITEDDLKRIFAETMVADQKI